MSSSTKNEEPVCNEYEALRRAKIARNEARLRSLGLLQKTTRPTTPPPAAAPQRRPSKVSLVVTPTLPLRRSKRTRKTTHHSLVEEPDDKYQRTEKHKDEDYHPTTGDPENLVEDDMVEKTQKATRRGRKSTGPPVPRRRKSSPSISQVSPNSARAMQLNVTELLCNDLLGKTLSKTGKAHVMEESARLAVNGYSDKSPISFNKYSGVQEWGNKVLFLWINLGAPNSDVTNEFPQGGRHVTWFGGSRMHDATPVIQRLVAIGKHPPVDGGVVLWCRRYIKDRKTFEPYTCLGRLSYVSHEPESHPLAFIWKLENFEQISNHADETRRETFRDMVQAR